MDEIKRLAHSSVLLKAEDKNIYIDPYRPDSLPEEIENLYEEPEKADLLLITHPHHDHCDPDTFENMMSEKTTVVAPENCDEKIEHDFINISPGKTSSFDGIEIEATHAYNFKRKRESGEPFHPKGEGVGYLITIGEKTIYHAGDTENIPEMKEIEGVGIAFLPIDGTYTMDIDEAIEAAKKIDPYMVIPFHERDADPEKFKSELESKSDI
ncbi:MAG: MBL fold metallo-hydrolase, partial [Candidatus Thermoplasmatota archaeon]|nr:MBL fold metallo-hydrolase [Candidatus Thermoplasmatota archaeon]